MGPRAAVRPVPTPTLNALTPQCPIANPAGPTARPYGNMVVLSLIFVAAISPVQQNSIFGRVIANPDVRNGYDDYVRAADLASPSPITALMNWSPNAPPLAPSPDDDANQIQYVRFYNQIRTWDQLQVFREE